MSSETEEKYQQKIKNLEKQIKKIEDLEKQIIKTRKEIGEKNKLIKKKENQIWNRKRRELYEARNRRRNVDEKHSKDDEVKAMEKALKFETREIARLKKDARTREEKIKKGEIPRPTMKRAESARKHDGSMDFGRIPLQARQQPLRYPAGNTGADSDITRWGSDGSTASTASTIYHKGGKTRRKKRRRNGRKTKKRRGGVIQNLPEVPLTLPSKGKIIQLERLQNVLWDRVDRLIKTSNRCHRNRCRQTPAVARAQGRRDRDLNAPAGGGKRRRKTKRRKTKRRKTKRKKRKNNR